MKCSSRAFTLTELLVAMAIFVTIMMLGTMAVSSFQRVGDQARQTLAIHSKAESVSRFLHEQLDSTFPVAGMYYGPIDDVPSLVCMRIHYLETNRYKLLHEVDLAMWGYGNSYGAYYSQLQWCIISFHDDGRVVHGVSVAPPHAVDYSVRNWGTWSTATEGIKGNQAMPTVQRAIVNLIGKDSGDVGRRRSGFYENMRRISVGGYEDDNNNGYTEDEYFENGWLDKVAVQGFFGETGSNQKGFAVANADGRTWNKDWMYLVGHPEDPNFWKDQRSLLMRDIEFAEVEFLDRSGAVLSGEDDSMADGEDSRDWLGLKHTGLASRTDINGRPAAIRVTYLLHVVPSSIADDEDFDGDGDFDERLSDALRDQVLAIADLSQAERRAELSQRLDDLGYVSTEFTTLVELP